MIDIINKEFEDLIIGYISKTLTVNDLKEILKKLKTPGNAEVFKEYVRINYFTIYAMNKLDTDSIIKEINQLSSSFDTAVSTGDYYEFIYLPEMGMHVLKNSELVELIKGIDFKKAFFGIFLSDNPIQKNLKKAMLGG